MKKERMRKKIKLCMLKCFFLCSLSSLLIQDASSASIPDCEIRASCSQSRECQCPNQMTVDPSSNVTLNCSIMNGGVTRGMTWNQVKQRVNASDGLVLQQMNSKTGMNSCRCINYTRAVEKVDKTSSPERIFSDKGIELKFFVKGWPRPRVFWYKPDGNQIINGSEGFHLSEELEGEDTLKSILRIPKGQENLEGDYTCIGENNISGWLNNLSEIIELIYVCPTPNNPTIDSPEVFATAFSNRSLKCLVKIYEPSCKPDLKWYFNNNSAPLKTGEKYKVQEKETDTKCKKGFILTIVNVTEADAGMYSCKSLCDFGTTSAAIELKVSHQLPASTTLNPGTENITTASSSADSRKRWILSIIILSSGGVFVLIIAAVYGIKTKKCASSEKLAKYADITSNKLFISYSSKDYTWVNENLISLFEKHSIPYSIHTRDFELGRPIVQNMADSVYGSRKVLIVLSDNYLASNFCREELHMAVQRGVNTGDSSLILVLINKLTKKRLHGALRSKDLLDFEKHKKKQDWEKKLLHATLDEKAAKANHPVIV